MKNSGLNVTPTLTSAMLVQCFTIKAIRLTLRWLLCGFMISPFHFRVNEALITATILYTDIALEI